MARHIINVHLNANKVTTEPLEGEIDLLTFKKFVHYCRLNCGPRLSAEAGEKLKSRYVLMRSGTHQHEKATDKRLAIPITVRQLEAIIRISESLAKMQLQPFVTDVHVNEALRLFQVSTLDAASTGSLSGAEGFTTEEDHELLNRIEKQLKRRFAIGTQVSEKNIIDVSDLFIISKMKNGKKFIYLFDFLLFICFDFGSIGFCASEVFRASYTKSYFYNDSTWRNTASNATKNVIPTLLKLLTTH